MAKAEFHHFGVPTDAKGTGETFIEGGKVHVTDPESHPFRVEFLRFEADTPMPDIVRTQPHAAFLVPSIDEALKGQNVVIQPFDATETLRVAFIKDGDALIEVMEMK
jgi:hypothetical protein